MTVSGQTWLASNDPGLQAALAEPHRRAMTRWQSVALATLLVAAAGFPWVITQPYFQHVLILVFLYALMAQSWNILAGYCGQVSLGHAVYFGLGAYGAAFPFVRFGVNPWLGLLLGMAVSVVVAGMTGIPTFRLRGHYFSIATLVIGEIIQTVFLRWNFIGAAAGLREPIVRESSWMVFQFHRSKIPYYYLALVFLGIAMLLVAWLGRSRLGFQFQAIKEDQDAARSLGIYPARTKLIAAALSAALMSLAGSFYAQYILVVDPETVFPASLSLMAVLMCVMGGAGTLWGPVIGAAVLVPLSEGARVMFGGTGRAVDLMIYGVLIMMVCLASPRGLAGLAERLWPRTATGPASRAPSPETGSSPPSLEAETHGAS